MSCACHTHEHHHEEEKESEAIFGKEFWIKIARLAASLVLMLVGFFLVNEENYGLWPNFAIMLAAFLIVGYDVLFEAVEGIFKEKNPFSEELLMTIATIGAFCIRFFGEEHNEFFEAVMVMFLFQVGELFEDIATAKSHKAITDAVGLRAKVAHKKEGDSIIDINPESLSINDLVLVKVGEILPADGLIEEGEGFLDMSSLTGESVPVKKKQGEEVASGTILKSGSLLIRVLKEYEDSTVRKIIKLMEDGAESKSKATRFVDKFAKIYTPIVVGLALIVAVVPPLFLGINDPLIWEKWIYTALSFLVISCPCAIVISVPLAYFAGIGLASRNGIIVKGAAVFDQLENLKTVVTDKTGTLTYGVFKITKKVPRGVTEEELLSYLKAAESRSTHPIASAIVGDSDLSEIAAKITSYDEIAGKGTKAVYDGKTIIAGNETLLKDEGIAFTPTNEIGSVVYVAVDKRYIGYVVCSDVIRKEALSVVEGLKKRDIHTCMLTGDKEANALAVSETLGIDEHHSELLPKDKTNLLQEKIAEKKGAVAFIGDGINDAPSISMADVGVAMGGIGSDLAIETADVVIMNDNPNKLVSALDISRKTRVQVLFNILFSILVKMTIMILALVIPEFPLLVAVLADTGLTMVLVLLTVTLLYRKVK